MSSSEGGVMNARKDEWARFLSYVCLSGVTVLANEAVQHQKGGATDHAHICHVECWPMPICQMEIEKIGHGSVMNSVEHVAERPSDDESQAGYDKAVARPQQPNNERRRNGPREHCERPRSEERRVGKECRSRWS